MNEDLCWTECPFFHYELQETPGVGEGLLVFCQFFRKGKEPMLSLNDSEQIEMLLEKMARYTVVFDDVPCISPVVWRKS